MDQALRAVPGVLAQSRAGGGDLRIVIRGFGARGAGDRAGVGLRRPVRLRGRLGVRASVRVENLLDERYVASAFLNPDVVDGEPVAFEPGLPRHAVATVSVRWEP